MTYGERVKEIRKSKNLTLEKFGEPLGVTKQTVSRIENGVNNLTDQMIKAICLTYNVNEDWIRTGEGDMYLDLPPEDEYFKAATLLSNDPDVRDVMIAYWKLDDISKTALKQFIKNIVDAKKERE